MKVAAIQHDIVWQNPAGTARLVEPLISEAVADGARLVVLTEMYATGFVMADADRIAEQPGGPSERFLLDAAKRHDVWLVASAAQYLPGKSRPSNVGLVVSPDGTVHRYAKLHPFSFAGEHEHYAPGEHTLTVEIDGVSVTLFICYDLRFANQFWALAPRTDCFVVIANWPEARRAHWRALLVARAIENQAYVVGVNRVGSDPAGNTYAGDSQIIDPRGRVLVEAAYQEIMLSAEVDPAEVREYRREFSALSDRRDVAPPLHTRSNLSAPFLL